MAVLRKLYELLTPQERRTGCLVLAMIMVMAMLDMLGVASILPFMAVLANPEVVKSNRYLGFIYQAFGFSDVGAFLFFLGVVVLVVLVVSIAFKALTNYVVHRFSRMREYSLASRLIIGYLRQPYDWFLSRHSADLGMTVLSEVGNVVGGALMPMMMIITHGTIAFTLLTLLMLIDPLLVMVAFFGLGSVYVGIYLSLQRYLSYIGEDRIKANKQRYKVVNEAFGGIKEIKVAGLEGVFWQRFSGPAMRHAKRQAEASSISLLPRFALEIVVFGGMMLLVLYLMSAYGSIQTALPVITVCAFAGYRLMPALQEIYAGVCQLRYTAPVLDALHRDLVALPKTAPGVAAKVGSFDLRQCITLDRVNYTYPNACRPAIKDLSLEIPAFTTVGLVGGTGGGKTTTVDIILGLLTPQDGELRIDGLAITREIVRAWQKIIGYVPQHIYLADDTIAANIAFGLPAEQVDSQAVERAARIACLHDFVSNELSDGYDTKVGERGVRLSGGQRQRIGIARALYHKPQVLVLDEATSALDNLTEQVVMEAVHNLGHGQMTIIIIAHRLSTVRECDRVYLLEKGCVIAEGSYEALLADSAQFRDMANAGES